MDIWVCPTCGNCGNFLVVACCPNVIFTVHLHPVEPVSPNLGDIQGRTQQKAELGYWQNWQIGVHKGSTLDASVSWGVLSAPGPPYGPG